MLDRLKSSGASDPAAASLIEQYPPSPPGRRSPTGRRARDGVAGRRRPHVPAGRRHLAAAAVGLPGRSKRTLPASFAALASAKTSFDQKAYQTAADSSTLYSSCSRRPTLSRRTGARRSPHRGCGLQGWRGPRRLRRRHQRLLPHPPPRPGLSNRPTRRRRPRQSPARHRPLHRGRSRRHRSGRDHAELASVATGHPEDRRCVGGERFSTSRSTRPATSSRSLCASRSWTGTTRR